MISEKGGGVRGESSIWWRARRDNDEGFKGGGTCFAVRDLGEVDEGAVLGR